MSTSTIKIQANGDSFEIAEGTTLEAFVESQGLSPAHVVVERNGTPVLRGAINTTRLEAGDRLEILRIVAGG